MGLHAGKYKTTVYKSGYSTDGWVENLLGGKEPEIMDHHLCDNECVMGEVLYMYEYSGYRLRTYDLKQRIWGVVKGLDGKIPLGEAGSHIFVTCGKKLILFLGVYLDTSGRKREIWYVEITVEKRQGGEIWGKVECCDLMLNGCFRISKCFVVTV